MKSRAYLLISGIIFGIVAVLHGLRWINQWPFQIGSWSVPMGVSRFGMVFPAILCVWAFWLSAKSWQMACHVVFNRTALCGFFGIPFLINYPAGMTN